MEKKKIEKGSVQETLLLPLYEESVPWRCIRETLMILTAREYTTRSR